MVVLESSRLFRDMRPEEWATFRDSVQMRAFKDGATIFREGDPGEGIYVVKTGRIEISAFVQGERRALSHCGPGDFFGEMAVLDNEPRSATVTAQGDTELYFIPRTAVIRQIESSPRLAVSLVREFSLRLRDFNRQYIQEVLQAERLTLVGRFARSIVHDFKNPLNVIGLSAEMMAMKNAAPAMKDNAALRIRKQVDRLGNMINELLEFTRGSQNAAVLAHTNYKDYIEGLLEELRPESADRKVQIETEYPGDDLEVLIDPRRLTHVFHNLVHNAVDALPDGGKIYIRVRKSGDMFVTEIEDTGTGLPPEILAKLFQPFATFGKAQGTGLGLSICKKIIEDHRGWIKAVNEPGRGAIFQFSIPAAG